MKFSDTIFWHLEKLGDIAQLARAPALQAGSPGFESLYLHQRKYGADRAYVRDAPPRAASSAG